MAIVHSGGKNKLYIFRVHDTGTAYSIKDNTAAAIGSCGAITNSDDATLVFNQTISTSLEKQDDGKIKVTLDSELVEYDAPVGAAESTQDGLIQEIFERIAKKTRESASLPERTYEDGTTVGGTNTDDLVLLIAYGATDNASAKVETWAAIGSIAPSSGSVTWKYGEATKPKFEFNSIFLDYAVDVADALDATIINTTTEAAWSLTKDYGYEVKGLTKAT